MITDHPSLERPMPTISLVIPAFNRERFIRAAIDSSLRQTVACDEILVVDDGSTDGTREFALSYGPRVRVISIANNGSGPSRPRNAGIRAATSSHIMFLDSDDRLEPTAVARCREVLERFPEVGLVCGNYYTVADYTGADYTGAGDRDIEHRRVQNDATTIRRVETRSVGRNEFLIRQSIAYETYCGANFIKTNATTVPRNVCLALGGFDETLRTSNDYDFFIRVLAEHDMIYIDEPLHTIVHHNDNISASNLSCGFRDYVAKNQLRVLKQQLARRRDKASQAILRSSIQQYLLELAYGYSRAGRPVCSMRAYAAYVRCGGAVMTAAKGAAALVLRPNRQGESSDC
jgi:glycosyltransferase involved in cell wall biosynthesis